jgi:hypothetical protein
MARERDVAARVISQDGERVQVDHRGKQLTVPMRGFPQGFRLRSGSRVILSDEPSGLVARPLVRALLSRVRPEEVEARGEITVADRRVEMQPNTIVEEAPPRPSGPPSDESEIWLVERAAGETADQVIAIRRSR